MSGHFCLTLCRYTEVQSTSFSWGYYTELLLYNSDIPMLVEGELIFPADHTIL